MSSENKRNGHVDELLSGYIDGELTQQESQCVRLHCENCNACRGTLEELRELRATVGKASLSDRSHDIWRETMQDTKVKAARGIGWLMVIGGALVGVGFAILNLIMQAPPLSLPEILIIVGIYGGLLVLLLSVLRQRLIERKTDKYKDVEI